MGKERLSEKDVRCLIPSRPHLGIEERQWVLKGQG